MTYDNHAATATINEQHKTIDQLRHELAQERELSDSLKYCVTNLLSIVHADQLDSRTNESLTLALSLYRDNRNYQLPN